ncbi:MAG: uroporphyrinogen decarboxylase family protein [Actinomycetota bacterium]
MDSRTRVEAALAREVADRPPYGWWGHTFVEEWSPTDLAAVTIERARRFSWDFVKLQPRATCFAEAFGSVYQPSSHPLEPPVLERSAVGMLEDWSWLPKDAADAAPLADQVEAIRLVAADLGPSIPVVQTVFSPITVAGYLMGQVKGRVVRELRKYPHLLGDALDRIAAALIVFSERSIAAGAAGIFYAVSGYASAGMVRREEYESLLLPLDQRVLEALPAQAWCNVLHLCGSRAHLDFAASVPVQAVSWSIADDGNPGLAAGAEQTGKAVMGGLAHKGTLLSGSPDDVAAEVGAAIAETGGRSLLVAPGCSVPPLAPEANLQAIVDAMSSAG